MLGADASRVKSPNAVMAMSSSVSTLVGLSRASVRFAARLAHAGALSALERLAAKQLEPSGESAEHGAGAGAANTVAHAEKLVMGCCAAFGRAVPRVSHRGCC